LGIAGQVTTRNSHQRQHNPCQPSDMNIRHHVSPHFLGRITQ
jgi:hypothetical protein